MRICVSPTPAGFEGAHARTAVIVVDVFRASTTITAALSNRARFVLPAVDVEQALRLAAPHGRGEAVLAGERDCVRIEGFHLGNSPLEFTPEAVAGKVVVFTTTNGTRALGLCRDAGAVFIGSFVNFSAVARAVGDWPNVTVLCAGNAGRLSLEDFVCAGGLVARLATRGTALDDAALAARAGYRALKDKLAKTLTSTEHARRLTELGFRPDLDFALKVDSVPLVPRLHDGRLESAPA